MIMIITITGPSGVGKTSIAKKLLELVPKMRLVVSLTTREPRASDLPGEYRCNVPRGEFFRDDGEIPQEKFLWVRPAHGNVYGTLRESVDAALSLAIPSLMLLLPETVALLRDYTAGKSVLSFYVKSPDEKELERRLLLRGEDAAIIQRRIADCRRWDEEAKNSGIPYVFVSNEEPMTGIEKAARNILAIYELPEDIPYA